MPNLAGFAGLVKSGLTDVDVAGVNGLPPTPLGMVVTGENGEAWKYVAFSGANAVAVGDVVCYTAADTNGTLVDDANTVRGAGVAMAAVGTSSSTQYAWIQIKGFVTLSTAFAGSSPAAGDLVTTTGASAPAVTKVTAATNQKVGQIIGVSAKTMSADFPW